MKKLTKKVSPRQNTLIYSYNCVCTLCPMFDYSYKDSTRYSDIR
ncbi:hypothetical protein PV797_12000 [Clostridiaceae bacterium M8S5]|nr:hypothetical protein PV797_12000 [Clostridiaceae bacterium M8S5]